ncbi:phage tail protein [Variovorax sp. NFACC27]|uniref:phage tail protein n=1 Tax=unclassified Variovorax TaxID=663243 RepID=UPI00089D4889|nr:Phage Tail Collar Domain [Variovorax sp. NFACC28]SEF98727.1 Phage Tail Collar Domain [Variovorax sp. NFACC29]SFB94092.1 Phage Tail Collar Domain [Variovorax sp. NFACC26]SFF81462.1 Phage Tail Collar Domain [Variovorax sp. NFACC27]
MAVVFENRVVESCTTLGTGNLVVSGADLGYFTFAEKVPVGSTIHYLCESVNAVGRPTGEFELGIGSYVSANTVARTEVVASSNAGALVNFTSTTKRLSLTILAPTTDVLRFQWQEALGLYLAGEIVFSAGNTPAVGTVKANGAALSRVTYARLFGRIGTIFGAGNGSTTFNVPDLRGEFLRGWDDGRGVDGGRNFGSFQLATHVFDHYGYAGGAVPGDGFTTYESDGSAQPGTQIRAISSNANNAVTAVYRYVRPRNIALLPCIRY